jgi:hypothetical protein
MAAPTWTPLKKGGTDQTQKTFLIRGTIGLSGNYTTATGIPLAFAGILTSTGAAYTLPPTYTGSDGPGQGIPLPTSYIAPIAGYSMFYDATNASIRIFNGSTELTTAALPGALTAAGIPAEFEFLRG